MFLLFLPVTFFRKIVLISDSVQLKSSLEEGYTVFISDGGHCFTSEIDTLYLKSEMKKKLESIMFLKSKLN